MHTATRRGEPVTPAYVIVEPLPGDRWLLCSDGLTGVVNDPTLEQEMRDIPDPKVCAERLVDYLLGAGYGDEVVADLRSLG